MGALASAVQQGKALYVGVSNYSPARTREAAQVLRDLGVPLLIHQPSYSMLNRHIENPAHEDPYDGKQSESLLDVVGELGVGTIVFSPLAQGLLTSKYLAGAAPEGSRAARSDSPFLSSGALTEDYLGRAKALNEIAEGRGQTLAQLALAWVLRDTRVTSALDRRIVGGAARGQRGGALGGPPDRGRDRGDRAPGAAPRLTPHQTPGRHQADAGPASAANPHHTFHRTSLSCRAESIRWAHDERVRRSTGRGTGRYGPGEKEHERVRDEDRDSRGGRHGRPRHRLAPAGTRRGGDGPRPARRRVRSVAGAMPAGSLRAW